MTASAPRRRRSAPIAAFASVLACVLGLALVPFSAEAQAPARVARIGFLSFFPMPTAADPDPNEAGFRQGLREGGYVEGQNIFI